MLFYYFDNKLALYNYLAEYSFDCISQYYDKLEALETSHDILENFGLSSKFKFEYYLRYPNVFAFLTRLFYNREEVTISDETQRRYNDIIEAHDRIMQGLYTNTNFSKFREEISPEKALRYIRWFLDGYTQEITSQFEGKLLSDIDLDPYWTEFDEILDDLKTMFYKDSSSDGRRGMKKQGGNGNANR